MKKKLFLALLLSIGFACSKKDDILSPVAVNAPDEVFNKLFTFSSGLVGSSLTHSVGLPDGRTLWLFSDSFIGTANADRSTSADKITAIRNAGMVQTDKSFLTLNASENSKVKNLADPVAPGNYLLFGHGVANGGNVEVFVHEYNITQRFLKLQIASFSFPALKFNGLTDLKNLNAITYGDYVYSDNDYHYIFGRETRGSEIKIHVARASLGKISSQATWLYYDGSKYVADATQSQAILATSAKQYSVIKTGDKFKIVLQKDNKIMAYTAPVLVGPYDTGKVLLNLSEAAPTSNAFVHTQFISKKGQYLISYDVQNLGLQNQNFLKNIDLFRPKFYRHDLL
jgi:hypothetical protein